MQIEPAFEAFRDRFERGEAQGIVTRLVADLETPVSAMLKLGADRPMSFLLESVEGGAVRGRYSIIGRDPDLIVRVADGTASINARAQDDPEAFEPVDARPLDAIRTQIDACRMALPDGVPAIAAGLFGFMGYEMVREMERLPEPKANALGLPDSLFLRPTVTIVFDSVTGEVIVTAPVWPGPGLDARTAYDRAVERLQGVARDLDRPLPAGTRHVAEKGLAGGQDGLKPQSNIAKADYLAAVEKAKDYIRAGDVFQVVPSQRFRVPFILPPFALYRSLRRLNPSPFLFYLNFGDFAVVGSSPELLVRLRDGTVTIRPIAGTAPRGKTPAEDRVLADALISDPKERAEHLMLLDLGRNDVGRVSETGSVQVTEDFAIEHYSHVMHIVSNVEGRLRADTDAIAALSAGFPAGTVSGAPKIRAMEIIHELEPERRNIYAGMVGYFASDGSMDNCIALRTAVVKDGMMYVQAGGGVVADSDPEAEYQETVNKARALMRAAQEAPRYASANAGPSSLKPD